jgi:hypothetical protein
MALKKDVFPRQDNAFKAWLLNAANFAAANTAALKITALQATALSDAQGELESALVDHVAAQTVAKQRTSLKNAKKFAAEQLARQICKQILNDETIPDSLKEGMGLRPHDTTRTPTPPPTVAPGVLVEQDGNRQHTVRLFDPADLARRAKPENVSQWQVFVAVGPTPPASVDACQLAATVARDRAAVTFDAADAGKTAWYIGRGVNSKGQPGPTSAPVAATIAA